MRASTAYDITVIVRNRILQIGIAIAILNFTVAYLSALRFGGVANGFPSEGPYFLDDRGHFTEVSHSVYTFVYWQENSVFLTHPLRLICLFLLSRKRKSSN